MWLRRSKRLRSALRFPRRFARNWLRLMRLEERVAPAITAVIQGQPTNPWSFAGPGPTINGQSNATIEASRPNPITGAINAVVVHPTNPRIAYVGAVNGGIWKTE